MNDMNDDGPAQESNPQPLAYQANALSTELLGLAETIWHVNYYSNIIIILLQSQIQYWSFIYHNAIYRMVTAII